MKKAILPLAIIATLAGSLIYLKLRPNTAVGSTSDTSNLGSSSGSDSASPLASPSGTPPTYKDGQYTGSAVDVRYGMVQVKATVAGGKITDITLAQMPSEDRRSGEISSVAGPRLKQEALQAQTANVDIISGATSTSEGFQQSLSNALSKAGA